MTSYSAVDPVSSGLYSVLNVASLLALAPGGVGDDIAQGTSYPCVLFEVNERAAGGFGTKPGVGQLSEMDVLVHAFAQDSTTSGGVRTAQVVIEKVIQLLANPPAVTGYSSWAIFHDETLNLGTQIVAGEEVKETVARFRLYVELA